ncbi:formate acetyltransferase [Lachnoclostridium phytofermentans ISDg]|uniref:Formate acetyltransferase n=2 Tax=Lachnoclostridium phytofermentans TaxID=66219 RepID=A9KP13_LACP7|nr:formate C-acetyltransferase [Lachnoclostridium phytofermentans]ABX43183.1 formate acetyltransferase [Lachnoclostridium phytofermentans ISDg]
MMTSVMKQEWEGFKQGRWITSVNVRDFIQNNYTMYDGDESFLAGPTEATNKLWAQVMELSKQESEKGGVLDMDTKIVSTIVSHGPGYLDKDIETIVGFQTDKPFKRSLQVFGGIRMAQSACHEYGYEVDEEVARIFTDYRKTHNQGVFDAYTDEMKLARKSAIITGLPDAYGRGRIIGDYRRVALYGTDLLIEDKKEQLTTSLKRMTSDNIRLREELAEQIRALKELAKLGEIYGYDITKPAINAKEAIQWLYFGYLAAVKEQNGAAMSLGRTSTFLDIYIQRDLDNGVITEKEAQEYIDHFIMKLRLVKFARTPEYNALFSGDPTWVTESIAGIGTDGRHMVTKTSFRYLHTLDNLGTAPEPNMTVLWSTRLPRLFKEYCAKMSIKSSSIQYENDDIMRPTHGDDYAIACCVSSMKIGKEMQFFGARANLAKCLLYAINGGVDEVLKIQVGPKYRPVEGEYLNYEDVMSKYKDMMEWLAELYVNTLNVIHYMHDKYSYERIQMALHDREVKRYFATGIAGLSVVADSLSAIKYAKVKVIRDENGVVTDYEIEGDYPKYGNNDDRVDDIAVQLVHDFMNMIRKHHTYRDGYPTMSILTITSNVVYGKKTGNTPDGRKKGEPLAPGANPMHRRDTHGAAASLASVAKLPFRDAQDGISNTFSIVPGALGKNDVLFAGDLDLDDMSEN